MRDDVVVVVVEVAARARIYIGPRAQHGVSVQRVN